MSRKKDKEQKYECHFKNVSTKKKKKKHKPCAVNNAQFKRNPFNNVKRGSRKLVTK